MSGGAWSSSLVRLQQEEALCLPAVMPQSCFLKAGIVLASHPVAFGSVASSQPVGRAHVHVWQREKRQGKNEGKQAEQAEDHQCRARYRTWKQTTFCHCCIVKANSSHITWSAVGFKSFSKWPFFRLFFQPYPYEPSLNAPSLLQSFSLFPLLFSLLVCLESLGLCCRHQINLICIIWTLHQRRVTLKCGCNLGT